MSSSSCDTRASGTLDTTPPRQGEWSRVKTAAGRSGWVLGQYLTSSAFVTVDTDKLNVRRGPGTNYAVLMRITRNYPLRVLARHAEVSATGTPLQADLRVL